MKKKGFTLIELLAVIVVLAIIALIATPIVMNTIKSAKKGAAERSADSYIGAVETAVATAKLEGKDIPDGTYKIDSDGNLTGEGLPDGKLTIDMKGNKPKDGTITIKNGQVTNDSTMTVGDYDVKYNDDNKKYEATEKGTSSIEVLCKAVTTATTGNVPSGSFNYGDEYTCELGDNDAKTFFVLETSGDNVSLIMNANVNSNGKAIISSTDADRETVAWSIDGKSHKDDGEAAQAVTAKAYLSSSTTNWTKLKQSQIKLPTKEQISGAYTGSIPKWLYDNLNSNSAPYGYWTSTVYDSMEGFAECMYFVPSTTPFSVNNSSEIGVRPVITISKSQLG